VLAKLKKQVKLAFLARSRGFRPLLLADVYLLRRRPKKCSIFLRPAFRPRLQPEDLIRAVAVGSLVDFLTAPVLLSRGISSCDPAEGHTF
jgi:hypothetical protein